MDTSSSPADSPMATPTNSQPASPAKQFPAASIPLGGFQRVGEENGDVRTQYPAQYPVPAASAGQMDNRRVPRAFARLEFGTPACGEHATCGKTNASSMDTKSELDYLRYQATMAQAKYIIAVLDSSRQSAGYTGEFRIPDNMQHAHNWLADGMVRTLVDAIWTVKYGTFLRFS